MTRRYPKVESIRCRYCNCGYTHVTHTWQNEFTVIIKGKRTLRTRIRRRRICNHCGLGFHTIEYYEEDMLDQIPTIPPKEEGPPPGNGHAGPDAPFTPPPNPFL